MARIGSRMTGVRQRPQALIASKADRVPLLAPSGQWTGEPGSGFSNPPVDPVRTTAKPAVRLIVPPDQHFTRQLMVGVIAFANANGTLIGGIDRVRFRFEGATHDVVEPTFHTFMRADGSRYPCLAYWLMLDKPASVSGQAHLYIEAIPADATMQPRVIGPYTYSPVDDLHDFTLQVSPSLEPIAGERFATLGDALHFLREQAAQNPPVRITEPMTEDLSASMPDGANHVGSGYCTIVADAPVTFARSDYVDDTSSIVRVGYNRLRFKGSNITFDMKNIREIWSETGVEGDHWLDGCTFLNSGGRGHLWRSGLRPIAHLVRGNPWFTECHFHDVSDPTGPASLARGCTAQNIYRDFTSDPRAAVYNHVISLDATIEWLRDEPAMNVTFTGPDSSASLALAGSNDSNTRTLTARWGGLSSTFVVGSGEARYQMATAQGYDAATAGEGYFVSDVAGWLNSLPGWSASVMDDSRRAAALSLGGLKGIGFAPQDTKDTMLQLVTCFDLHGDFFQHLSLEENCVVAYNSGLEMRGQNIFVGSNTTPPKDFFFVGNAFANIVDIDGYARVDQVSSQFSRQPYSHVVYAHNSMPGQRFFLRTNEGFDPDGYCMVANNAHPSIRQLGPIDADLVLKNNAVDANQVLPPGSIGGFAAGSGFTKVASLDPIDLRPAGELVSNPAPPVVRFDLAGRERANPDAIGAFAMEAV
jgi:hypothetical protein